MKQKLLILSVLFLSFSSYGQDIEGFGGSIGSPLGDAGDIYEYAIGVHGYWLMNVEDNIHAGIATGYNYFIAGDSDLEDVFENTSILNFGLSARYTFLENFSAGVEGGVAATNDLAMEWGIGYYVKPQVAYRIEIIEVSGFYQHLDIEDQNFPTIGIGISLVDFGWLEM